MVDGPFERESDRESLRFVRRIRTVAKIDY